MFGLVLAGALAAVLAAVAALLVVASAGPTGRRAAAIGLVVLGGGGIGTLLAALTHLTLDRRGAVPDRLLHRRAAELEATAGRPVVVGSSFGAWPRGTGDGTALLTAVLAELHTDRVGLVVAARDHRVAAWYTAHGARPIDPDQPRLLTWPP